MTHRDTRTATLATLLEAEGIPQARARAIAAQVFEQQAGSTPGTVYGDVDSLGIARIWERATFAGVRRLVLDIEAQAGTLEQDDGLLTVRVQHSEKWPEWNSAQEARAAGLVGLVESLTVPDSWTATVQEMAQEGAKGTEHWQEAQARALAKSMN